MDTADKPTEVRRGKVKWFSPEKGYGFIEMASKRDVFVHFSSIAPELRPTLRIGEEIEFGDKGKQTDQDR